MSGVAYPYVLTVAGYDPSGGAGILADAKTFNALGTLGLTVLTANTLQTDRAFHGLHWIPQHAVEQQLELMLRTYPVRALKFGIVRSYGSLARLRDLVARFVPELPVIIDPILRASAGFRVLRPSGRRLLDLLRPGDIITPNLPEFHALFPVQEPQDLARQHGVCILLKGGHAVDTETVLHPSAPVPGPGLLFEDPGGEPAGPCPSASGLEGEDAPPAPLPPERQVDAHAEVTDFLITPDGRWEFTLPRSSYDKHGTGCVLSAALAAFLAHGERLEQACALAQRYVAAYLRSTDGLLGLHAV